MIAVTGRLPASFRDPSGFLFERDGALYRQVNRCYEPQYERLMASGLYRSLVEAGLLVPHEEVDAEPLDPDSASRVLRPSRIPFLSYPYEWCFGQLQDAALLTLEIQRRAISAEMSMKDASAYNVQFLGGRPVFIDTLSFETLIPDRPWVAYRQFCQHFLAPLALMAYRDVRLGQLLRSQLDGLPIDLASRLLPARTWGRPGLLVHLHLHAQAQRRLGNSGSPERPGRGRGRFGRSALLGLIDHLESTVRRLRWRPGGTEWDDYYQAHSYSAGAFEQKRRLVAGHLERIAPGSVWDLGANTGEFARLASGLGIPTVAFDLDPSCVERAYRLARAEGDEHLLPLWLDLSNPSPALGWEHRERWSMVDRGPADAVLALALIHHLALAGNVPLGRLAGFFARVCRGWLLIEFVPKTDPQAARLLRSREDIFADYNEESFRAAFDEDFAVVAADRLEGTERTLYLLRRRDP